MATQHQYHFKIILILLILIKCIKTLIFKMVKGCRIDTGPCKKVLSKRDPQKTVGTRGSCKTGTGLDGQRTRQA